MRVVTLSIISNKIIVLQINGPDKPGLFTRLCRKIADLHVNILEISQSVLRGFLSITFLLNTRELIINLDRFKLEIQKLGRELEITAKFHDYQEGKRPKIRNLYIFTFMGQDKSGILADLSLILSKYKVNIEEIEMRVKGNWIFNQLILDIEETIEFLKLRTELRKKCESLGLSMVLQTEKLYRKNKKLIVFDMDSTIIAGETIVEIAKKVNKQMEMNLATENAMKNNINFEKSLLERVLLIKGVSLDALYEIANDLEITSGMEELIFHLKNMGWKIAVVSSGFSVFTEVIKEKLELDYAFGNTLEISDNVITGKVLGTVIDGKEKWNLVKELGEQLGISYEEIVTVGDGSNDQEMLKYSGLGIGLNSKEITSEVADGRISSRDVNMILLMLGMSDTEIETIIRNKK